VQVLIELLQAHLAVLVGVERVEGLLVELELLACARLQADGAEGALQLVNVQVAVLVRVELAEDFREVNALGLLRNLGADLSRRSSGRSTTLPKEGARERSLGEPNRESRVEGNRGEQRARVRIAHHDRAVRELTRASKLEGTLARATNSGVGKTGKIWLALPCAIVDGPGIPNFADGVLHSR
jgi:hypothetical protein